MIIMAIKASVAFQTIPVTSAISCRLTAPAIKARTAPPQADQPIDICFGCHMTNTSVSTKISADKTATPKNISPYLGM